MLSAASKVVKVAAGVALKGAAALSSAASSAGSQSLTQLMRASAATIKGGASIAAGAIPLARASFGAGPQAIVWGVRRGLGTVGNSVHSVGLAALESGVDGAGLLVKGAEGVANAALAAGNATENLIVTGDPRRESQDWLKEIYQNFGPSGGGGLSAPGGGGGDDSGLRSRIANDSASFRQNAPAPQPAAPPPRR